jgi:hypothetical protein
MTSLNKTLLENKLSVSFIMGRTAAELCNGREMKLFSEFLYLDFYILISLIIIIIIAFKPDTPAAYHHPRKYPSTSYYSNKLNYHTHTQTKYSLQNNIAQRNEV